MQLPSALSGSLGIEAASRSRLQPSGQQMPSTAFSDAKITSIRMAANLCTGRL
jgi:hypothetical protein